MSDYKDLYQELILDHNQNPQNFGTLNNATNKAKGDNPLCGDHINIELIIDNNIVKEIKFNGNGCAISKASASLMTTAIKGKNVHEIESIIDQFIKLITGKIVIKNLGKLQVFENIKEFPTRTKCASLAWHTMKAALNNQEKITTENE